MKLHRKVFWLLLFLLPVQLGKHFWSFWSYVLGLKIDYLSPTIFLTDILVFAIFLFWLLDSFSVKKLRVACFASRQAGYGLKKYWWILVFFIYLFVNSWLAKNFGAAIYKFLKILEFSLLGFYIANNKIKLSFIAFPLSFSVIYSSLIAFVQFISQSSLNGFFWFLGERTFNAGTPGIAKITLGGRLLLRPYATFPHPNVLAGFILVSLLLTLPYFFQKNKFYATFYFLFATLVIIISFSRSAWLVGALVIISFILTKKKKRLNLWIPVVLLLFFGGIFYFGKGILAEEAFLQRVALNKIALQLIKLHLFTGIGLNNFISQIPDFWRGSFFIYWLQPVHNIYLLIAAETGLVGLLIFLWFLYLTFKKLNAKRYPLIIALFAILALGLFDHYWFTLQQTQLLFAITLGLSWKIRTVNEARQKRLPRVRRIIEA